MPCCFSLFPLIPLLGVISVSIWSLLGFLLFFTAKEAGTLILTGKQIGSRQRESWKKRALAVDVRNSSIPPGSAGEYGHCEPVQPGQQDPLPRPAVGKDDARPAPLPPLILCPAGIPHQGRAFWKPSACLTTKIWPWLVSSSNQRHHLEQILERWMGAWRNQHFWGLPQLETLNTAVRGLQRGKRWGLCLQWLIF